MSEYQCCGTTMLVAPAVSPDGVMQLTRLCMLCELRLIEIPQQRTSAENRDGTSTRQVQPRPGIALQRPWSEPAAVRSEPFEPAGFYARATDDRAGQSTYSLLARLG